MHENETSPFRQPEQPVTEQIPHSGIHHGERPVEEFDKTPLPDAVERGLVTPTPDSAATLAPAPEQPKKRNKLLIGGSIGLAGAVIAAGAVIGVKAASDTGHTPPEKDPKATFQTPEATPSESSVTTPEHVYTVQELLIPATLTGEDAAKLLVEQRLKAWTNAGESYQLWNDRVNSGGNTALLQKAQATGQTFSNALFVPNWRQMQPSLVATYDEQVQENAAALGAWLRTYKSGNPADKEPYVRSMAVDTIAVVSQTNDSVTMTLHATEHDNGDGNRVGPLDAKGNRVDGNKLIGDLEFEKVDGAWKISHLNWHNAQQ
ncbi:hypothetical protein [Microbacterium capsulatum]|uniref:Uncharacterized protein n=1 Tax=Microbacterium capsulatum TaxID=3041921 RepID=A0ABU0XJ76_9MICO|nr:hypothetical protein [Microbacterium sp. ASV81]MDQ4213740.1 hypothetical protein [Microbacterium sp. ASV81]